MLLFILTVFIYIYINIWLRSFVFNHIKYDFTFPYEMLKEKIKNENKILKKIDLLQGLNYLILLHSINDIENEKAGN